MSKPGYPQWWNTTITIYCKYIDPETDVTTWYRYVVTDCFWKYTGERTMVDSVELSTSSVICRIPESEKYLSKYLWYSLSDDEKNTKFTIGREDIIIPGIVTDTVHEYNSELGIKSTDLLTKYSQLQGCMIVEAVSENIGGGRNNSHYYVQGNRGSYGSRNW